MSSIIFGDDTITVISDSANPLIWWHKLDVINSNPNLKTVNSVTADLVIPYTIAKSLNRYKCCDRQAKRQVRSRILFFSVVEVTNLKRHLLNIILYFALTKKIYHQYIYKFIGPLGLVKENFEVVGQFSRCVFDS